MENEKSNGYAKKTDNKTYSEDKKQLIETIPVIKTPFTIVRNDDKYFVTLGMFKMSGLLASLEDAIEEAEQITWDKIINVIQAMIESHEMYKNETNKENENQQKIEFKN